MVAEITDINQTEHTEEDFDYYSRAAKVPDEGTFGSDEFVSAPVLGTLADRLIEKHGMLAGSFTIDFYWKRKAGNSGGKPVLGKVTKLSGLTKHYAEGSDFAIWIAANHVRDLRMTNYQLEAALFHELLHIQRSEDAEGDILPLMRDHDFDGFFEEVKVYGNWRDGLKSANEAFEQVKLFPDAYLG